MSKKNIFEENYPRGNIILAENLSASMNDLETKRNNNVLIIGSPGSGKTTGLVLPNILQGNATYLISDPKGRLYYETHEYLEKLGYETILIDFRNPGKSAKYNPLMFVETEQDIMKMASVFASQMGQGSFANDRFWDECSKLLISSIISYLKETCPHEQQTLENIVYLLTQMQLNETSQECELDNLFRKLERTAPSSFAVRQYKKFRSGPIKTLQSVVITALTAFVTLDNPELNRMTSGNEMDFKKLGEKKCAVYLVVSDIDRSMDFLANIFFTQAMSELCMQADLNGGRLSVPVQFILDDFATNVKITDFHKYICSIRSRNISAMIVLQAQSQLYSEYQADGNTIISACDTYIYTGGNDFDTAEAVAKRYNTSVEEVLLQPLGMTRIYRRGEKPVLDKTFCMFEHRMDFEKRIRKKEGRCIEV